uniref:Uncharacterized protein n=1 Tax=Ditylenchus dipsaci TaxID=166011 RepID=A0A915DJC5_9BILA
MASSSELSPLRGRCRLPTTQCCALVLVFRPRPRLRPRTTRTKTKYELSKNKLRGRRRIRGSKNYKYEDEEEDEGERTRKRTKGKGRGRKTKDKDDSGREKDEDEDEYEPISGSYYEDEDEYERILKVVKPVDFFSQKKVEEIKENILALGQQHPFLEHIYYFFEITLSDHFQLCDAAGNDKKKDWQQFSFLFLANVDKFYQIKQSPACVTFLKKLKNYSSNENQYGAEDIKKDACFIDVDWEALYQRFAHKAQSLKSTSSTNSKNRYTKPALKQKKKNSNK